MAKKSEVDKQKEECFDWDPVKYAKDGKKAQAVIWSTNVINAAVEAINQGLPLKANPFIGKNTLLLKPDLVFRKTEWEIEEAMKCMEDPVYFASKCQLMTPTGLRLVELRDYQVDYLHHLQNNRFTIWLACRQAGKSLTFFNKSFILFNTNNLDKKTKNKLNGLLKRYYFYIDKDNNYIIDLPLFELINLYDNSFIGRLRYHLYKIIYQIEYGRSKKTENVKEL